MKTVEIIFSPTGGTEKVARILTSRWELDTVTIDLSDAKADFSQYIIEKEDRVLIAMPSFGGRAPAVAMERLKRIAGNGAGCTLVCVYGNRAYEDTLVEMEDAAKECGFRVIAAVAAVAEHSCPSMPPADRMMPIKSSWSSLPMPLPVAQKALFPFPETVPTKRAAEPAWFRSPPRTA